MFEVQLFGNEFIMISTDKRFDSRSFPFWCSPGSKLALGKFKTKLANYPCCTYITSPMKGIGYPQTCASSSNKHHGPVWLVSTYSTYSIITGKFFL